MISHRFTIHGLWLVVVTGCASMPLVRQSLAPQTMPAIQGSYHVVQRGETLWSIAHSFGLNVDEIVVTNHLKSPHQVSTGQSLIIPLPIESDRFLWPVRGSYRSQPSKGLEVMAPAGSFIRASRGGHIALATDELSGWGSTVVIDHRDGTFSVYAGLDQLFVSPDAEVEQGMSLGCLGSGLLYFEIRRGKDYQDPLALLPPQ